MAKQINADKLISDLPRMFGCGNVDPKEENFVNACEHLIKTILEDAPKEDADMIRHGKWLIVEPIDPGISTSWRCSECGEITIRNAAMDTNKTYKYCPYCGARMDLGDQNGTDQES